MKTKIMKIAGNWDIGYVLDWHVKHSEFLGYNEFGKPEFDTTRTEIGEAIFRLKYRQDQTRIEPLAETMVENLRSAFQTASFVVPMPPSKNRASQPTVELARRVSKKMNLPFFENILLKKGTTPQMKDILTIEDRVKALMGCFCINDAITNCGLWDVLVIDDLYSSGASLSAATRVLRTYNKVRKIFVAAFSRTK
ncbi:ComF family protein [Desulfonema magnum]|uniref:Phosphoribosyltransferase domain-containing protein n=1 Tax=Desulfonema magnum TaxID=45655 RepID=A0A975BUJ4_9BACT|nr:ComF family protein [Desulfonema magnum]QTA91757.1 phosphoribosyltransferase domain-containing protein [Desulfonema magnum]